MVQYVSKCKTPCAPNAKSRQTHNYVHITHSISTHKFECPEKILTLDEVNYRKLAQIYVNVWSYMNTCNITHIHIGVCTWLIGHGHITCNAQ